MLLPMVKVQIVGTKRCLAQTVPLLQHMGVVQIETWHEARSTLQQRMAHDDEATRRRERLAYQATQVDALLSALPPLSQPPSFEAEADQERSSEGLLEAVERDLAALKPEVQALSTERDQLEAQLSALPRYEATLRQLLPLIPAFVELEHYAITAILIERRYQAALETIRQNLEELTNGLCEVIGQEIDQDNLAVVLVFPRTQADEVSRLLGQENISQLRLPPEYADQPLEKVLKDIRQRLAFIPRRLAEIETQINALARQWRPRLLLWQALLRDQVAQIEVCANFGQTDYTFVIEGWLPEARLAELEAGLARQVGDELVVAQVSLRPEEKERAPVALANPSLVKPFEPLLALLALPKQGGFDPTPLMALFMPIFFGLILGDVAYGAILFGLMFYVRRRFKTRPTLRSLAEVLMIGAAWSILFGFLFGEFLGTLGESMGLHPLWFDRGREVQALFLLTIGIGAGHIVLGLSLGVWQAVKHHRRHELIEKMAMLVSLAAIFLLVAVVAKLLPDSLFTPAVALLAVGLAVLIYSLGSLGLLLGPLELLGTLGNILSYLRIAAIGLSSVYLAQVANELAGIFGNILIGLIIAGFFHALNIALGAFSPTIQSLRLHYVEFFSKFYQGGGQPFEPFQRSPIRRE